MLNYLGVTCLGTHTSPPTVSIVAPLSTRQKTMSEITFIAYAPNADRVIFDFGDGSTAEGNTVTHTYEFGAARSVTVTCTATNAAGGNSTSIELTLTNPAYVWQDAAGINHSWDNPLAYMVLHGGVSGLEDTTAEAITEARSSNMGEFLKTRAWKRRDQFGFDIRIIGATPAEIETNRKELIKMLSNYGGAGKIFVTNSDGTTAYINAEIAYGYPRIVSEIPYTAELRFIAPDPFWYGEEIVVYRDEERNITTDNPGNVPSPSYIICISDTAVTNTTTGESITSKPDGDGISGVVVTSGDGAVTATTIVDGIWVNALSRFALNSQFFKIQPGVNIITGAYVVVYRPRWSGI